MTLLTALREQSRNSYTLIKEEYYGGRIEEYRRGNQMQLAAFTKHIESVHNQEAYQHVEVRRFCSANDFKITVEKAIRGGNRNKAVGADGLQVEMFQAAPAVGTRILTI